MDCSVRPVLLRSAPFMTGLRLVLQVSHLSSAFSFTSVPSVFMAASARVSPFLGVQLYRCITSSYLVRLTLSIQFPNKVMVMDRTVSPPPKKKKKFTHCSPNLPGGLLGD